MDYGKRLIALVIFLFLCLWIFIGCKTAIVVDEKPDWLIGTLYLREGKSGNWFISTVEGYIGKDSITKAQIRIVNIPEEYQHVLVNRLFVRIEGKVTAKMQPGEFWAIEPSLIEPTVYDPIPGSIKRTD